MSGADPRPRPQYGEYATPEEQRARIAQPHATDALAAGETVTSAGPSAPAAPAGPTGARGGARTIDRVATIALLVYGFFNVAFTAPRLFDVAAFTRDYLALLGVDAQVTDSAAAQVWGPVAAVVYVAGWVATAAGAWWRLRRGGIAFWIPLVGAVVTTTVVALCLTIPLVTDPAFLEVVRALSPRS